MKNLQGKLINKEMLSLIFIIIGTVIGAGFVSGREIIEFFSIYGNFAPIFTIFFGILMYIGLFSFLTFSETLMNPKMKKTFNLLLITASIIGLSTMIAALKSILGIILGTNLLFYPIIIICYFIIVSGLKSLSKANQILLPITIAFIIILSILTLTKNSNINFITTESSGFQQLTYPFLYFGLNIFTCFPLCQAFEGKLSRTQKKTTSIIISSTLTLLIIIILIAVSRETSDYTNYEMPTLVATIISFPYLAIIATISISIGIITTLLSYGIIIKNSIRTKIKNEWIATFIILLVCLVFSNLGFKNIVKYIYPIVGTFGLLLTIATLLLQKRSSTK